MSDLDVAQGGVNEDTEISAFTAEPLRQRAERAHFVDEGFSRLMGKELFGNDALDGVVRQASNYETTVKYYRCRDREGKGVITCGPGLTDLDPIFKKYFPEAKEGDLLLASTVDAAAKISYGQIFEKTARRHSDVALERIAPLASFRFNTGGDIEDKAELATAALKRIFENGGRLYSVKGELTEDAKRFFIEFAGMYTGVTKAFGKDGERRWDLSEGLRNRRVKEILDMFGPDVIESDIKAALVDAGEWDPPHQT